MLGGRGGAEEGAIIRPAGNAGSRASGSCGGCVSRELRSHQGDLAARLRATPTLPHEAREGAASAVMNKLNPA